MKSVYKFFDIYRIYNNNCYFENLSSKYTSSSNQPIVYMKSNKVYFEIKGIKIIID